MPLSEVEEFRRLVLSAFATHILVMAFLGFGHVQESISRFVLIVSGLMTAFLAQPMRYVTRNLLHRLGLGQIPAFVVGDGPVADRLLQTLASSSYSGFRIVRRFTRDELREVVRRSEAVETYTPDHTAEWEQAYQRMLSYTERK